MVRVRGWDRSMRLSGSRRTFCVPSIGSNHMDQWIRSSEGPQGERAHAKNRRDPCAIHDYIIPAAFAISRLRIHYQYRIRWPLQVHS